MTDVHLPIGSGETHTIASSWAAATEIDLVAKAATDGSDAREFGEIKSGETVTDTIQLNLDGATVDIDNYRILTTDGAYYDVKEGTGSTLKVTFVSNTAIYVPGGERYFRILGIRIFEDTTAERTFNPTLYSNAKFTRFGYLTLERTDSSGTANTASYPTIWLKQTESMLWNSIVIGNGTDVNFRFGARCGNPCWVLNNVFYKLETTGLEISSGGVGLARNNIAMECGTEDFDYISGDRQNNLSSDGTASGTNSHANETLADILTDADNGDFSIVASSNADAGGDDQSAKYTDDYYQVARPGTFGIGAIEVIAAAQADAEYLRRSEHSFGINPLLRM